MVHIKLILNMKLYRLYTSRRVNHLFVYCIFGSDTQISIFLEKAFIPTLIIERIMETMMINHTIICRHAIYLENYKFDI